MEYIVDLVVNNGTAIAVMIYFIYKDNKWTETLYSTLGAIKSTMQTIENHFIEKEKTEE